MQRPESSPHRGSLTEFAVRVALACAVVAGLVLLLAVCFLAVDVLLLIFAGILVALLLRAPALLLARHTPLNESWSVLALLVLLVLALASAAWLAAAPVVEQFNTLLDTLPRSLLALQERLHQYPLGSWLVEQVRATNWSSRRLDLLGRVTGALSNFLGSLVNLVVICFLGIYFALQPRVYLDGLLHLVPVPRRARARQLLAEVAHTLRWWLLGTLLNMTVIGVLTGVGLWLLGLPVALALGVLAGLLSFVPYLGAVVSAVPAVLIALVQGPQHALYVVGLYLGVHFVEGYLLTPLVQQYAVELPPALLLAAQILLGLLLGLMGVLLAAPLAATGLVLVRMLYVHDLLGDRGDDAGSRAKGKRPGTG